MNSIKKIVIIGGESTGKSTLCKQLAAYYKTTWVNEFARNYLENLDRDYNQTDLIEIAKGQILLEDELAKKANKYLFCDTDLHVLQVWSEYKYQDCDRFILDQIATRKYDAYIITSPDFPWEPDPLREHPEPELRAYFFRQYLNLIENTNLPICVVRGNQVERMNMAIDYIDKLSDAIKH
ncbi:MAG TPA: ATP-binding protein [Chitinophagaceae bacterium]|jgi:NadR type nicotinamide-nucleotide adenylyltransferase|nr:ATP-binding protein [Chitinophagaceae bacterium]